MKECRSWISCTSQILVIFYYLHLRHDVFQYNAVRFLKPPAMVNTHLWQLYSRFLGLALPCWNGLATYRSRITLTMFRIERRAVVASLLVSNASTVKYLCCNGAHVLSIYGKFKGWSVEVHIKCVLERWLHFQCLSDKHWWQKCSSKAKCAHWLCKHYILIHQNLVSSE